MTTLVVPERLKEERGERATNPRFVKKAERLAPLGSELTLLSAELTLLSAELTLLSAELTLLSAELTLFFPSRLTCAFAKSRALSLLREDRGMLRLVVTTLGVTWRTRK